ncbi:MAG: hypothetical protein KC553_14260 [Nitrospina sp.]|nr:hypothetical protein [Nitrospina sp.]
MTISMNHRDLEKLRAERKKKITNSRKKRSSVLSDKAKSKMMKKFDEEHEGELSIDEHVKMNDSYMRTGLYVPKKK